MVLDDLDMYFNEVVWSLTAKRNVCLTFPGTSIRRSPTCISSRLPPVSVDEHVAETKYECIS